MKSSFSHVTWISSLVLLAIIYCFFRYSSYPELETFIKQEYSLEIYDRNGVLLKITALEDGLRRNFKNLDDLPDVVEKVFIIAEDSRFYFHPGVDPLAVLRAWFQNRSAGKIVSGASTISMQLARIISGSDHGYKSKISEIFNAIRLESRLSKNQILELWLNNIPFSFQIEGVAAGSLKFLGKDISLMDLENSFLLAVIPRSPANLNPLINKEAAVRTSSILGLNSGLFDTQNPAELDEIADSISKIIDSSEIFDWPDLTPHFSLFTENMVSDVSKDSTVSGEINTSIDYYLNEILSDRINYYLSRSVSSRIKTGAGIIINNSTGEILAYLGSADFYDIENSGQIDGVQILNQPGSTLKPFLYALGLENGFLPNSVLPDIPQYFGEAHIYQPVNFDGAYHGPVLLRVALASSLNVPAVYMINRLGVLNFADYLIRLGFESVVSQRESVGTGLALGNAEVSLMELTRAFSVFPRGGQFLPATPFLTTVNSYQGNITVMKPYTAGIIRDILTDNNSRYPGFGNENIMDTAFEAMFKTGTSNQFQNIWALGSSPEYTVGIWMGNFSGNTIIGRTGSSLPAAIAAEMLDIIHTEGLGFSKVPDSREIRLCTLSGLIPNEYTPSTYLEFLPLEEDPEISDWHTPDPESNNTVLTVYPEEYSSWLAVKDRSGSVTTGNKISEIIYPADNSVFFIDPAVPASDQILKIKTIGFSGKPAFVLVNGINAGETNNGIYSFELRKGEWEIEFMNNLISDKIKIVVR
jgi:penicillin-binding protein 1C